MARKRETLGGDYGPLRRKILGRSALLFAVSGVVVGLLYRLFLYHRFADLFVAAAERLVFHDPAAAAVFYTRYVRSYIEVVFYLAIALVFVAILRFYLRSFTRYFNEINSGVNAILARGEDVRLSPELRPTEEKINAIKHALAREEQAAREAEKRKNDLVLYLAHDIRTPLTSVIGYLSLLAEDPALSPERRAEAVRISLDKARRLEGMVNELFEITRGASRRESLQKTDVDLCYLLLQLTDELTPLLAKRGNRVRLAADEDLTVPGDPDLLARAFGNLLKNAAAYSTPGTEIGIRAGVSEGFAAVRFRNLGKTIPQEKLEDLFEPFFRLDEARSSDTGGSGLGLAIAREIAERHGGDLSAESGGGVICFTLRLPLEPSQNLKNPSEKP